MKLPTLLIVALALAALLYLGIKWRDTAPPPQPAETALLDGGAQLYRTHCADCHGTSGMARGNAPDLRAFDGGEATFREAVLEGFYPMPEFEGVLTADEIHALWVYVSSLRTGAP